MMHRAQEAGSGTVPVSRRNSSCWPLMVPKPTIWPELLMAMASSRSQGEPGRQQRIEIDHGTVRVQKSEQSAPPGGDRDAHYLTGIIDIQCLAEGAPEGTEIGHAARRIQEGMFLAMLGVSVAYDFALVVDSEGIAVEATERAEI